MVHHHNSSHTCHFYQENISLSRNPLGDPLLGPTVYGHALSHKGSHKKKLQARDKCFSLITHQIPATDQVTQNHYHCHVSKH